MGNPGTEKYRQMRSTISVAVMLAACAAVALAAEQPEVGWSLEFDSPDDLRSARIACIGKEGVPPPNESLADVRAEDGVLHLGAKFNDKSHRAHYVTVSWGVGWGNQPTDDPFVPDPQPERIEGISVQDFPVLEVRWRRPEGLNQAVQGNCIWLLERPDGTQMTAYTAQMSFAKTSWTTTVCSFAPDSLFPGPFTPVKIVGIRLELGAQAARTPAAIEFDYLRVRKLGKKEYAEQIERAAPLRTYQVPPVPERLKNTFVYATCHEAPYAGGWEGYFDELTRAHINGHVGAGQWYCDMTHVARSAEPRGVMLFPYVWASPIQYEGTWATAGPDQAWITAEKQVRAARDLPAVVGWFIADEPPVQKLLGVAGIKNTYDKLDPDRLAIYVHFSFDRVRYFDRFTTVITSDHYPVRPQKRDPWNIAKWCREIDKFSPHPQWFWPQAFGDFPWYRATERYHSYAGPTPEEFRLMMHLALANGAKGFILFNYSHVQWMGVADKVGNLSPIGREAAAIGERWLAVCPLLLRAETICDPAVTVEPTQEADHGVSVAVMGDPEAGPLFLVAVNEDLKVEQGTRALLPEPFTGAGRAVYDLYGLTQVAPAGTSVFDLAPLPPGDGRIYMLATGEQFAAARVQIITHRVNEMLRVQGADRQIAKNWNVPQVEDYSLAVQRVRDLLASLDVDRADTEARAAGKLLEDAMNKTAELRDARQILADVKKVLGELNLKIHVGAQQPRTGREDTVAPFEDLCRRYSRVRNDYLTGRLGQWTDFRVGKEEIRSAATALQKDVHALAERL